MLNSAIKLLETTNSGRSLYNQTKYNNKKHMEKFLSLTCLYQLGFFFICFQQRSTHIPHRLNAYESRCLLLGMTLAEFTKQCREVTNSSPDFLFWKMFVLPSIKYVSNRLSILRICGFFFYNKIHWLLSIITKKFNITLITDINVMSL